MINIDVINECRNKKFPFPEVMKRLNAIDIERYYTDLVRMEKIYYSHNGDSYVERMPIEDMPQLADQFNDVKIIESIRANQKGEIDYHNFIRNIVAAGTASYTVYIDGKQVAYTGRKGEVHIEKFPI